MVVGIYLGFEIWNLKFERNHPGHHLYDTLLPSNRDLSDVGMNTIPTRMLGNIHRIIRGFDKPLQVEVVSVFGKADADCDV